VRLAVDTVAFKLVFSELLSFSLVNHHYIHILKSPGTEVCDISDEAAHCHMNIGLHHWPGTWLAVELERQFTWLFMNAGSLLKIVVLT
jgi:hypothetical protein